MLSLDYVTKGSAEGIAKGGTERAMPKKHVFLSYCRENQAEVKLLRDDLIAAGENIWWDQDLLPGQNWALAIEKAMENAYAVILCLSKESEARVTSGIYPEASDAISAYRQYPPDRIFLIPVLLSDCAVPSIKIDSTRKIKDLHYVKLFPKAERTEGIAKLLQAIKATPHHP
ncbi:MAG: hypothetical protein DMG65_13380 [Candidatus Angelobacter sp. Gp1-AA117]|nr:MAG: hypothetical protein DMG65_13380 [Candidatus Angelobacter sp. Gp1-AA117]